MSENILNAYNAIIEGMRCSNCKEYLSYAPIWVLLDGGFMCDSCMCLIDYSSHGYIANALEDAFSCTLFPCRFAQNGCAEKVLFDNFGKHESKCVYRSVYQTFACPTAPQISCKWEGYPLQMLEHFKEAHPELILDNMELALKTEENKEGVLLTVKHGVVLIVKFKYDCNKKHLTYRLCQCNNETSHVSYETKIYKNLSGSMRKAPFYDGGFCDMHNALLLNLGIYLGGKPKYYDITIVFDVKVKA